VKVYTPMISTRLRLARNRAWHARCRLLSLTYRPVRRISYTCRNICHTSIISRGSDPGTSCFQIVGQCVIHALLLYFWPSAKMP
jgi:hypothetical protein